MAEFNHLFDQWAGNYDNTVYGDDNEYAEVFEGYSKILSYVCDSIVDKSNGAILEIGVGTGNLTKELVDKNFNVIGIEPSKEMRKIAMSKLPRVPIFDGHFLDIPIAKSFDGIVTSYAFHHLTLQEKKEAITYLDAFLKPAGKLVIADTMFESPEYKKALHQHVKNSEAYGLLEDLRSEYYEYVDDIKKVLHDLGYSLEAKKMNKYVWIITASKGTI
ncbi:putative AdoMet-dependent methyltransferase [Natronincola peptidivorans]|uniref:Uncharacterized methyltransferase SAMN05660297_01248 n=1 Tax=Natronincola peptidivorans TaxID=426128 RepID=A0A1I0BGU5_9FIRM|nr:class I SAM-dependent methyltransferase [Natronincola peptidivorans]SET05736.1 putative AdoMet-dependent methyltransferase [Natronincola peptidivorans]